MNVEKRNRGSEITWSWFLLCSLFLPALLRPFAIFESPVPSQKKKFVCDVLWISKWMIHSTMFRRRFPVGPTNGHCLVGAPFYWPHNVINAFYLSQLTLDWQSSCASSECVDHLSECHVFSGGFAQPKQTPKRASVLINADQTPRWVKVLSSLWHF